MMCMSVKKLAATIVAVMMMAAAAWAQGPWNCGSPNAEDVTATLTEDGTLTISGTGAMRGYNYPQNSNAPWYSSRSSITSVVIEDGVTSVGDYTFTRCVSITSVTIGNSVDSIRSNAFAMCSTLTSVTIGNSVTSIGYQAFYRCVGLTSVTIPDGVTSVEYGAFNLCTSLTSVTIPNSVTSIGEYAFAGNTGLKSVTIGNSVTSISARAFSGCTGLTSITSLAVVPPTIGSSSYTFYNVPTTACLTIPEESVAAYGSANGWRDFNSCINGALVWNCGNSSNTGGSGSVKASLKDGTLTISGTGQMASYNSWNNYAPWVYDGYSRSITSIVIEDGVTSIGGDAFRNGDDQSFTALTSITIGASVTSIGQYAFDCSGPKFESLTVSRATPPTLSGDAFTYLTACITVPEESADAYRAAWGRFSCFNGERKWYVGASPNAASVVVTPSEDWTQLTISGAGRMANYSSASANIPWFYTMNLVTELVIEDGVESIGNYAFANCSTLTTLTIPNSVDTIGGYSFQNCKGLTSVTIGDGAKYIGSSAFSGCADLATVTISAPVPPYVSGAFNSATTSSGCLYAPVIQVGGVKYNLYGSASGWSGFTCIREGSVVSEVSFDCGAAAGTVTATLSGDGTLKISGAGAMANYTSTNAPWNRYSFRAGITSVVIEDGVTSVGNYAFYNLTALKSAAIGGGVTAIGINAFESSGLTAVRIPEGVASVGNAAFRSCSSLMSVISVSAVPPNAGGSAFGGVTSEACLYVPASGKEAYGASAAYEWNGFACVKSLDDYVSVASPNRVVPTVKPKEEATVIAPTVVLSGEFTAGPNPISRQSGIVKFFRQGKRVANCELRIYDATGNIINSVKISDKAIGNQSRRVVGSWNLTDKSGRQVSEGTYLVKGVIKTSDGKSEKVSVILGVR